MLIKIYIYKIIYNFTKICSVKIVKKMFSYIEYAFN